MIQLALQDVEDRAIVVHDDLADPSARCFSTPQMRQAGLVARRRIENPDVTERISFLVPEESDPRTVRRPGKTFGRRADQTLRPIKVVDRHVRGGGAGELRRLSRPRRARRRSHYNRHRCSSHQTLYTHHPLTQSKALPRPGCRISRKKGTDAAAPFPTPGNQNRARTPMLKRRPRTS